MPSPSRRSLVRAALLAGACFAAVGACAELNGVAVEADTITLGGRADSAEAWVPTKDEPVSVALEMGPVATPNKTHPIRVRIHNGSDKPLAIGYGRSQGYTLLVALAKGTAREGAVWSPGQGGSLSTDATITDPLRAGRDTAFVVNWQVTDDGGHGLAPGRYRARALVFARLLRTQQVWTAWVPFEVRAAK